MNKFNVRIGIIGAIACIFFTSSIGMDAAANKDSEKKSGPGVLSFEEIGRDELKIRTIKPSEIKISILDINSRLRIKIDKEAIKKKAADQLDIGISPKMLEEIGVISDILNMEAEMLGFIGESPNLDEQTRIKNFLIFSQKMGKLEDFVLGIPSLEDKVVKKMEESKNPGGDYEMIFSVIREEIDRITNEYNLGFEELNFRLGGWINRGAAPEPIHIEGFDSIQKGEFYEFPFIVPPTPEEWEKLKKLPEAAKNINEKGLSAVLNIKEQLNQYIASFETEIKDTLDCILESQTKIKGQIISQVNVDLKEQFKATDNVIQKVKDLIDLLNRMKKVIQELAILPGQLEQNIQLIQSLYTTIKNDISSLPTDIENAWMKIESGLQGALTSLGKDIKDETKKGIEQIKNVCLKNIQPIIAEVISKIDSISTYFKEEVINNVALMSPQWGAALELSDKVESFSIDEIPVEGNVDLRFLGKREEGNELYFKAIVETKPKAGEEKVQAVTIDQKYFILFKMVFIKFKPALIFAAPLMKKAERVENGITLSDKKTYQAAASYSVLFKFGNRKSVAYNQFLRIGIGINVAALDFNQDSNYEVGLGLVLSGFNDFVQVGVGRNMDIDANYFFFGINLPIGEISLPKIGSSVSSE